MACKRTEVLARPTRFYTLTTQIGVPVLNAYSITPSISGYSCHNQHKVCFVQAQAMKTTEAEVPNTDGKYHPKLKLVCLLRTFKVSVLHRCCEQNAEHS